MTAVGPVVAVARRTAGGARWSQLLQRREGVPAWRAVVAVAGRRKRARMPGRWRGVPVPGWQVLLALAWAPVEEQARLRRGRGREVLRVRV